MSKTLQLDLFGEVEASLSRAERARAAKAEAAACAAREHAEWVARFERADWVAPYDTADGRPAGHVTLGWKCPACGQVEPNEFLLGNNHGYHLHWPGHVPYLAEFGKTCSRLELLAAHAIYDKRLAQVRHLIAVGLDDEQVAARVGFWDAQAIGGYRKDDAKAARRAAKAARGEVVTVPHGDECPCAFCEGPCACASCEAFRRTGAVLPADPQGSLF